MIPVPSRHHHNDDDALMEYPSYHRHNTDRRRIRRRMGGSNSPTSSGFESSSLSSMNPTIWVRRLVVISCLAGISNPHNRLFPVCSAFVVPRTQSRSLRIPSEEFRSIDGISNRPNTPVIRTRTRIGVVRSSSKSKSPSMIRRTDSSVGAAAAATTTAAATGVTTATATNKNDSGAGLVGLLLAVGIILSLAGMSGTTAGSGAVIGDASEVASSGVAVVTKVVENTVPTTSTEVVAVTLGESIGGVIGAVFSVAINFVLRGGKNTEDSSSESSSDTSTTTNGGTTTTRRNKPNVLYQGLSDGDYFIANSASNSILELVGVPESVAKYSSIFIAAIPSQLVKIGSRISEQKRVKEDQFLYQLLLEEQQRKANKPGALAFWKKQPADDGTVQKFVNPKELVPVRVAASAAALASESSAPASSAFLVDFVEVFADVTRWLEYDVLKTEYGESASLQLWMETNPALINPLQAALTYALLGSLAAVSSRWYADVLYGRFGYGPIEKQEEVRSRNNAEWFSLYSSTAASASALFGCYEFFQLPIGRYIQGTLSGGVEGCVGSSQFEACMQTFIDDNAPGPSPEAQLRALITNLYAVYVRLGDIAGDTTTDDVSALIRAWSVSLASFIANMQ